MNDRSGARWAQWITAAPKATATMACPAIFAPLLSPSERRAWILIKSSVAPRMARPIATPIGARPAAVMSLNSMRATR